MGYRIRARASLFIPLMAIAVAAFTPLLSRATERNEPAQYRDIRQQFKYGSIGAEGRAGIPYWIWLVLPDVFPQYLPDRPGKGYARIGFLYESESQTRPIGVSYREKQVPLVGLNCAVCHTGRFRDSPGSPVRIVLGMPAHQFQLQAYFQFLISCARDERFNAHTLIAAIERRNPGFSWLDGLFYRFFVIPQTRSGLLDQAKTIGWMGLRPPQGPGRVDTFNPYKAMFGFDLNADTSVGTADLPSLWNQRMRRTMWLHWDGNNNLVEERNKSAAIGAGATEDSLDLASMKRIEDWIMDLQPPSFPAGFIDRQRALRGKTLYDRECAPCHAPDGKFVGQVTDAAAIGTDPERVNSFTASLAGKMNTIGQGKPWHFSHFRKTNGYANMPLDGIWLRSPYLHNGSVPALRDLLEPPEKRPRVFYRGYEVYDYTNVGFISQGTEAQRAGFRYDTALRGNSNSGHNYGTGLKPEEKQNLLEYLKTL